jgi:hypothetical protein
MSHKVHTCGEMIDAGDVTIRGNASAEDVAAVLATLAELAQRTPTVDPYERWRRTRLAALRPT